MTRKYVLLACSALLFACSALLFAAPALAQNAVSGSPRVQGTPDGYGDPVQVTIVASNGADMTGTTANQVQGNVAAAATDSGNPVKAGGVYNSTFPTYTAGQRGDVQLDSRGALRVVLSAPGGGVNYSTKFDSSDAAATDANGGINTIGRLTNFNGTTWDRVRGDTNGMVVQKGLSSTVWRYANGAAGILSNTTTAVTIKTAAGASVRNYIDSCQINTTAFGASVPIAIRDGAAGTVIFALNVPTAGFLQPVTIVFETPLQGTANTLLEVVTPTANTTGTAWVNCQGHTGS